MPGHHLIVKHLLCDLFARKVAVNDQALESPVGRVGLLLPIRPFDRTESDEPMLGIHRDERRSIGTTERRFPLRQRGERPRALRGLWGGGGGGGKGWSPAGREGAGAGRPTERGQNGAWSRVASR